MIVKYYDEALRKLFRLANGRTTKRIAFVLLCPFVAISHLMYGIRTGFNSFMEDLKGAWNYVERK